MFFFTLIFGAVGGYAYEKVREEIWRMAPKGLFVFRVISFLVCLVTGIAGSTLLAFHLEGVGFRYGSTLTGIIFFIFAAVSAASIARIVGYDKRMRA